MRIETAADGTAAAPLSAFDKLADPAWSRSGPPQLNLPRILLEMHARTGFAPEFTRDSEHGARATSIFAMLAGPHRRRRHAVIALRQTNPGGQASWLLILDCHPSWPICVVTPAASAPATHLVARAATERNPTRSRTAPGNPALASAPAWLDAEDAAALLLPPAPS